MSKDFPEHKKNAAPIGWHKGIDIFKAKNVPLVLAQAAFLIRKLSGIYINRQKLYQQHLSGNIKVYWHNDQLVVDKNEAIRFSKVWKGAKRGPKAKIPK